MYFMLITVIFKFYMWLGATPVNIIKFGIQTFINFHKFSQVWQFKDVFFVLLWDERNCVKKQSETYLEKMYICDSVVNVCQRLPERYPVEDATFIFFLNYETLYRLLEPLHRAWIHFLMMFFLSTLQIPEVWTNFLLAACE